ncbi:MAG: universal stress protein [Fulvivirga sp.]|nr:universal stress protein [Fulvivirga sp.]
MNLFENILVPFDFSDCAKNALIEAARLAKLHGGRVSALHVIDVIDIAGDIKEAKAGIQEELEVLYESYQIDCTSIIIKDVPAEGIIKQLENEAYTLCILGSHERHHLLTELIGTIPLKVMQHAKTPILIIPEPKNLIHIEQIAFATDFKKIKDHNILNYLHDLCAACSAELHLLNVNESPQAITRKEAEEALELHNYFFDIQHEFNFARAKNPIAGINDYVSKNEIDMLAVMPRHHSFFHNLFNDSVSEEVALNIHKPIFSFHE